MSRAAASGTERMMARVPRWLVLAGLILLFFYRLALRRLILARGDIFLYIYPYWQAAADALRRGRLPLWNPDLFMGAPFLANSQVGLLYPLNWPLWLLLPTPYAATASILLHLWLAGVGAYLAGKWTLGLGRSAALLTAVLYGLGGYLTAQVEHLNQLQGLAWLPWFFAVLAYGTEQPDKARRRAGAKMVVWLSLLFALQLLAGHAQTSFITAVSLLIWLAGHWIARYFARQSSFALHFRFYQQRLWRRAFWALPLAGLLALALASAQLLPTVELIQQSARQGGLSVNEVLSFSLHPALLTRALLPAYGQSLFSEYVAILPLTALLLAVIGGWQWRQWRGILPALLLTIGGLLLALGLFNPVYWLLARLPGFDLFRVPARWLVLYGLGVALLAGAGWQMALERWQLQTWEWEIVPERARRQLWQIERPLRYGLYLILGFIVWGYVANVLVIFVPTGPEAPYEAPGTVTLLLWALELALAYLWLSGQRIAYKPFGRPRWQLQPGTLLPPRYLTGLILLALFAASRSHSYHLNATAAAAYFDLRPPLARLQVNADCQPRWQRCPRPPERFISLSSIQFDLGDQAELNTIYTPFLNRFALRDYVVASKHKEVISPNLPLAYGVTAVDGFDGGILPLSRYSELVRLLLPVGVEPEQQSAAGALDGQGSVAG